VLLLVDSMVIMITSSTFKCCCAACDCRVLVADVRCSGGSSWCVRRLQRFMWCYLGLWCEAAAVHSRIVPLHVGVCSGLVHAYRTDIMVIFLCKRHSKCRMCSGSSSSSAYLAPQQQLCSVWCKWQPPRPGLKLLKASSLLLL
jgi:hypothetical protein